MRVIRALLGLSLVGVALAGAPVLFALVTNPLLPPGPIRPEMWLVLLRTSGLPTDLAQYLAGLLAWALWAYLVSTSLLRVLVAVNGARSGVWIRARMLSDAVTLPVVRHAVDGLVGALLLTQTLRPVVAHAEPVTATSVQFAEVRDRWATDARTSAATSVRYWVQPADSLWAIATRFYADGEEWPRIFEANRGRAQPEGGRLADEAVIRPGWVLDVPLPAAHVSLSVSHGFLTYEVQRGDSLASLAARFLGSATRWNELWEQNQGLEMAGGERFTDPDLIRPGWVLRLPERVAGSQAPSLPPVVPPPSWQPEPALTATLSNASPAKVVEEIAPTPEPEVSDQLDAAVEPALEPSIDRPAEPQPAGPPAIAAVALGAAVVSSALIAHRLRVQRRRLLHDDPEPSDLPYDFGAPARTVAGGFLAADVLRLLRQRARGVETNKVALCAERLRRVIAELGLGESRLLTAHERERDVTFLAVDNPSDGIAALLGRSVQEQLEGRLAAIVHAEHVGGADVMIDLQHLRAVDMAAIGSALSSDLWLPLGVEHDGRTLHANVAVVRHLLVAAESEQDAAALLTSLVVSAASSLAPERLELVLIHRGDALESELANLPHVRRQSVAANDTAAIRALLVDLEDEVVRRSTRATDDRNDHRIVVACDELAALGDRPELAGILHEGGAYGLHVLAMTSQAGAVPRSILAGIPGRLVFRVATAQASVDLLGRTGAEELEPGGEVYVGLAGRAPIRIRGFRIETPDFRECVETMRTVQRAGERHAGVSEVATSDTRDWPSIGETAPALAETGTLREDAEPTPSLNGSTVAIAIGSSDPPRDEKVPVAEPLGLPHVVSGVSASGTLQIRCFGPLTILRDGREVTDWGDKPASRELLAFLAIRGRSGVSRDQLIEGLLPGRDPESAVKILHPRLATIRKVLREDRDHPFIRFAAGQYRLELERVWIDVAAFDAALSRSKSGSEPEREDALCEAAELYRGELFADHCPEWALEYQDAYRASVLDTMNRAAACAARRGDHRTAADRYRRALTLDPINEEIAANLARALHQLGDRTAVTRLEASLLAALRRELDDEDVRLQPETEDIFNSVLADLTSRSSAQLSAHKKGNRIAASGQ